MRSPPDATSVGFAQEVKVGVALLYTVLALTSTELALTSAWVAMLSSQGTPSPGNRALLSSPFAWSARRGLVDGSKLRGHPSAQERDGSKRGSARGRGRTGATFAIEFSTRGRPRPALPRR